MDLVTFLTIEYSKNNTQTNFSFIVPDYYNISFLSVKNEGEIQESRGNQNQKAIQDYENYLDSLIDEDDVIFTNLKSYVRISYLNFENKRNNNYYEVGLVSGNYIDSLSGQAKFEEYKKLFKPSTTIEFSKADAIRKFRYMNKQITKSSTKLH